MNGQEWFAVAMVYLLGLGTGAYISLRITCWMLKTRAKQHGMQSDLERLLAKPVKRDRHVTWINSGLEYCGRAPAGWQCTRIEGHDGPCEAMKYREGFSMPYVPKPEKGQ